MIFNFRHTKKKVKEWHLIHRFYFQLESSKKRQYEARKSNYVIFNIQGHFQNTKSIDDGLHHFAQIWYGQFFGTSAKSDMQMRYS